MREMYLPQQKHNILIDCERQRTAPSGLGNYCNVLIEGLAHTEVKGQYDIYGPDKGDTRFKLRKFLKWHHLFNPYPYRYQVVHITHQRQHYLPIYDLPLFKQPKMVLTLHDLNPLKNNDINSRRSRRFIKTVRSNLKHTNVLVCISQYVKNDLLENYVDLFPEINKISDIRVIYNGVPTINEDVSSPIMKQPSAPFILSIGQALKKKNMLTIVEMLPLIDEHAIFVVDKPYAPYAQQMLKRAEELGVSERITLLANISESEKHQLLQQCSALVHPSLAEGFGYPPVEAMQWGKPIFVSRLTSLPEIGDDVAFYFDSFEPETMAKCFKEGMATFNANPEPFAQRLKARAQYFSVERMAQAYADIYLELITSEK